VAFKTLCPIAWENMTRYPLSVISIFNYFLRNDGDFCHQGWDTEIAPKSSKLSKPIDIHWKALEEHVFTIPFMTEIYFGEKFYFLNLLAQNIPTVLEGFNHNAANWEIIDKLIIHETIFFPISISIISANGWIS
jgi:hypothetical protein